ncbi:hypothetical protein BT67DRAFT_434152 [Trichocladium antarcticum]|uniref:2EXR domain-containing protein n=1 Tax=Trichocladium antarcticum TaxID=1450529 RepID=A0AAN6UKJ7_9PEZI|nr:hypothetical protein BT67DRAFT_434152 [Trichocladium antarcticum]
MAAASTFTLFPLLPPELRLEIWHHTLTPRIVTLTPTTADTATTLTTTTRPPAILHANHESRTFCQRHYVQCPILPPQEAAGPEPQQAHDSQQQQQPQPQPQQYFHLHPTLDTLYIPRPATPAGYSAWLRAVPARVPCAAAAARRVALDYVPAAVRRPWEVYEKMSLLRGCGALDEAVLVIEAGEVGRGMVVPPSPPGDGAGWMMGGGEGEGEEEEEEGEEEEGMVVGLELEVEVDGGKGEGEGEGEGECGEVEFVGLGEDGDGAEVGRGIVGLVRESFRYEGGGGWGFAKDDGEGEGEGRFEDELELVPMAKVVRGCAGRPPVVGGARHDRD